MFKKPVDNIGYTSPTWCDNDAIIIEEPKHIQKHYAYTYEAEKSTDATSINKFRFTPLPRKKFLESNFDENEKVITTVIETELPLSVSDPKYSKKTHAYCSDPPKWMKKYLNNNESPQESRKNNNVREATETKTQRPHRSRSPKNTQNLLSVPSSPGKSRRKSSSSSSKHKQCEASESCDVILNIPNWNVGETCQILYETSHSEGTSECDSDSSTSI